jgi:hypothetical protein
MNRFVRLLSLKMSEAGADGTEGGGGGGGAPTIDPAEFAALRDTVARLEANNKALLAEKIAAKKAADDAAKKSAVSSGDMESREKWWETKLNEELGGREAKINSLSAHLDRMTSKAAAMKIATDLAVDADAVEALLPHIVPRLKTSIADDSVGVVVLDADGKETPAKPEDLMKELMGKKALSRLIKGSSASGDGGAGKKSSGAALSMTNAEFLGLSHAERMAFAKKGGKIT